jgi:hypothetical protein
MQEPAKSEKHEGSAGPSRFGSPSDRVEITANRHALSHRLKLGLKVAEKGKSRLKTSRPAAL